MVIIPIFFGQASLKMTKGNFSGPIIYTTICGTSVVVINSAELASEILDRRGVDYADRPFIPILRMAGLEREMEPYGPFIRGMRRLTLHMGNKTGVERYTDILHQERHRLVRRLLDNPDNVTLGIHTYGFWPYYTLESLLRVSTGR
jgi:hypothetical protein